MKNSALILALAAALAVPAAHAAYRCKDEKGVTHIGETPPAACAKVPMQEINATGRVLRTIEPTLTQEQAEAKRAAEEQKKEADKAAAEQKRKDLALLSTYASEKEFDVARDRNIEPITGRINTAKDRLSQLEKREKQLNDEAEFYKAGKAKKGDKKAAEMPANITQGLEAVKAERATIEKSLKNHEKEIEQIKARFEEDKKRWVLLKQTGGDPSGKKN